MKVAAITGGAQGIGRNLAMRFAARGYAVSICDVDKAAGFEVIRAIRRMGGKAMFFAADVAKEEDVERWIRLTVEELGGLHALINNAGIGRSGSMLELPIADWDRVIGVNLRGTFLCSRIAARVMAGNGGGAIVNISSTRALMSEPDTEAYAASKGGILALTHAMAVSLGPHNIRVNAVLSGWIETRDWQFSERAQQPVHSERDRLQHPVGRVGTPDDISEACLYLVSDKAGFITGQRLVIDGGMTVKMIYEE
ncbi:SDR family NAD(P)-dependent oxidoreductase [Paenibacillus thermotolerans]|uniref:SDR family NAD(P)-dependent oxidoreductase n=1 Tax=Paenibacillus thermotolerans TaxID=3027807 RepID=UPI0023689CA3|nr:MULTISPECIES: glucose 1-dehydrogenase [unclassified Paenibacillus]